MVAPPTCAPLPALISKGRSYTCAMCRIFGCVASEPVSIRHELVEAENPLVRQAELHDSGWGMAVYPTTDGAEPRLARFPTPPVPGPELDDATGPQGRIFNVHVRRATYGGLTLANTHPFARGTYSFSHNGTVIDYPRLLEPGVPKPVGETDSEVVFNYLMCHLDPADARGSLRQRMAAIVARSPFSALNFLFSDGTRLYAYRLGVFELHWLARPGQLLVSSEKLTGEAWKSVDHDVLLTLDPERLDAPRCERLLGDELIAGAEIRKFEGGAELRGDERGAFAAERAAQVAAATSE